MAPASSLMRSSISRPQRPGREGSPFLWLIRPRGGGSASSLPSAHSGWPGRRPRPCIPRPPSPGSPGCPGEGRAFSMLCAVLRVGLPDGDAIVSIWNEIPTGAESTGSRGRGGGGGSGGVSEKTAAAQLWPREEGPLGCRPSWASRASPGAGAGSGGEGGSPALAPAPPPPPSHSALPVRDLPKPGPRVWSKPSVGVPAPPSQPRLPQSASCLSLRGPVAAVLAPTTYPPPHGDAHGARGGLRSR